MDYESSEFFDGALGDGVPWISALWNFLTSVTGVSVFATALGTGVLGKGFESSSLKLVPILVVGYLFTIGKSLVTWAFRRFSFQYYITAQFNEGDPTYDWLILLLTNDNVWKRSKDFRVTSKSSQRKWSIGLSTKSDEDGVKEAENAEYVPTYSAPQLWRWNGYWIEVTRNSVPRTPMMDQYYGGWSNPNPAAGGGSSIYLTIYTFDMSVLSKLVETARKKYYEISRPYIIIHSIDTAQPTYGPVLSWNNVKKKNRRPLESIILGEGVLDSIIQDAREFIKMEEWYVDAGIPHRRGYLLHGPPGTGKSSTIYAIAGELGMEIYSLSLAANFVDDSVLQRAASSIPKNSIFLIEDIDCAFPNREDEDDINAMNMSIFGGGMYGRPRVPGTRSAVTLSGLLNVLDGVGSEEGKLFFATTNYIDHLDAAFLRPGRIDMKIEYNLSNKMQAQALFKRFYPTKHIKLEDCYPSKASSSRLNLVKNGPITLIDHPTPSTPDASDSDSESPNLDEKRLTVEERIAELADIFADGVPVGEFSTAELQGYLLIYKKEPVRAAEGIVAWVEAERKMREEKKKREQERIAKQKAKNMEMWGNPLGPQGPTPMNPMGTMVVPPSPPVSAPAKPAKDEEAPVEKALPTPELEKDAALAPVEA